MKTLNDYFTMNYRMEIVEDKDEGGFVVSFPELPGCITCGETVESAVANALDAKKAWLEAAMEDGIEIHEPDSLEDYSVWNTGGNPSWRSASATMWKFERSESICRQKRRKMSSKNCCWQAPVRIWNRESGRPRK